MNETTDKAGHHLWYIQLESRIRNECVNGYASAVVRCLDVNSLLPLRKIEIETERERERENKEYISR